MNDPDVAILLFATGKLVCNGAVSARYNVNILVANLDGKIVALSNGCTHRGYLVSKGKLFGVLAKCPMPGQNLTF